MVFDCGFQSQRRKHFYHLTFAHQSIEITPRDPLNMGKGMGVVVEESHVLTFPISMHCGAFVSCENNGYYNHDYIHEV